MFQDLKEKPADKIIALGQAFREDPRETENVAAEKPNVVARLTKAMNEGWTSALPPSRT